jgi:hypothetical protein
MTTIFMLRLSSPTAERLICCGARVSINGVAVEWTAADRDGSVDLRHNVRQEPAALCLGTIDAWTGAVVDS